MASAKKSHFVMSRAYMYSNHSGCARGSMINANISGDKGHPCLVPLVITSSEERAPDVNIECRVPL